MARLRFEVEGELGSITARALVVAVQSSLSALREYDVVLSGERHGSLTWVITNVATGSVTLEIESRSRLEEKNVGLEVVDNFVRGLRQIEQGDSTPAYLSPAGMDQIRRVAKLVGRQGTTGFRVTNTNESAEITAKSSVNLDRLLQVRHRSLGSVEGRILTVSIRRSPRFILYDSRTKHAIACHIPKELKLPELLATETLGKRVIVFGLLHSNSLGDVLRIDVERIRQLRSEAELPGYESLGGSDPDFTGNLTTAEYIRSIRDD